MKKIIIFIFCLILLTGCSSNKVNFINKKNINDIELLDNNYYLFYPSDSRTTQNYTYVKELNSKGQTINTFKVTDSNFSRINSFQNPMFPNIVYLQRFGEATLDMVYYEYDLNKHSFAQKSFDFFDYDVGINNFFSYGKNMILSTVLSHKTGDQNATEDGKFQMSISNTVTKKSVEIPYDSVPMITPNLSFGNKGIYMTTGYLSDTEIESIENKGIGIVDFSSQKVDFLNPEEKKGIQYWSVYSDDNNFYVFSDLGTLYKYERDFTYTRSNPLKNYVDISFADNINPLYITETKILYSFYSEEKQVIGKLSLEDNTFEEINLEGYEDIRFLYYDPSKSEVYITANNKDGEKGALIILSSSDLSVKKMIPIDDSWMLDFIIHK